MRTTLIGQVTVAVALAAVVVGVFKLTASRSGAAHVTAGSAAMAAATRNLPAAPTGFRVPTARILRRGSRTAWAPVLRRVVARRSPRSGSAAVGVVSTQTPEATTNIVDLQDEVVRGGRTWVRVGLASLPDGRSGWIPRDALGGWTLVSTRVIVDRAALTLTLYRSGRPIFETPVGVGAPGTPTPAGRFYVRDRLTKYASPEYGPVAFGTSARSAALTDWPAGGFIGIHGTDEPGLIPGRISHGCIRLRNSAIKALARLLPVGTPVIIR